MVASHTATLDGCLLEDLLCLHLAEAFLSVIVWKVLLFIVCTVHHLVVCIQTRRFFLHYQAVQHNLFVDIETLCASPAEVLIKL